MSSPMLSVLSRAKLMRFRVLGFIGLGVWVSRVYGFGFVGFRILGCQGFGFIGLTVYLTATATRSVMSTRTLGVFSVLDSTMVSMMASS